MTLEEKIEVAIKALNERNIKNLSRYVKIRGEEYFFLEWINLFEKKEACKKNNIWEKKVFKLYCKYISCILDCLKLTDALESGRFNEINYAYNFKTKKITPKTMRLYKNSINDAYDAIAYQTIITNKESVHKILCALEHIMWHYLHACRSKKYTKSHNAEKALAFLEEQEKNQKGDVVKDILQEAIMEYSDALSSSVEETFSENSHVYTLSRDFRKESDEKLRSVKDNLRSILENSEEVLPSEGQWLADVESNKFRKHSKNNENKATRQNEILAMNILNNLSILSEHNCLEKELAEKLIEKILPVVKKLESKGKGRYSGWNRMRAHNDGLAAHQRNILNIYKKISKEHNLDL